MKKTLALIRKAWHYAWHRHHLLIPIPVLKRYFKSFIRNIKRSGGISSNIFTSPKDYSEWRNNHKLKDIKSKKNNEITILYTIKSLTKDQFIKTIDSIINTSYKNIIIVISSYKKYQKSINSLLGSYSNIIIKLYDNNKPLSYLYNESIRNINTKYICFINSNILFEKESLSYINNYIEKKGDLIYSDEDHINDKLELCNPSFKPDYSFDSFIGFNYFKNVITLNKDLIKKVGKFNNKYKDLCFNEFLLRCINKTNNILHIPEILYHDFELLDNNFNSSLIKDYIKKNKINAKVVNKDYIIKYNHNNPFVSIIIPFKDQFKLTKNCITNLLDNLKYKNYELILIDNGSKDKKLLNWLDEITNKFIRVYHHPIPFNFSTLCNFGINKSRGSYCLLLNNDTKIIDNDFLDWMVGFAQRKDIGAVGLKLLYNDNKIQHLGVSINEGGYATHVYATEKDNQNGPFNMRIRPYTFTAVTGACLLIEKKKYKEVNGLDENLSVALNDVDLCLKLIDKGYHNICLNNIKMYHFESKSRGFDGKKNENDRFSKERNYMKKKWGKDFDSDKFYSKYFF